MGGGLFDLAGIKRTPIPFTVTPVTKAVPSTASVGSVIPVGFSGSAVATVIGYDAQVRKNNNGAWGSSIDLAPGDLLNVQMTSADVFNTSRYANVDVNGIVSVWQVKTCTNPALSFTDVTGAVISTVYNAVTINHSNTPLLMTITGGQISSDNINWGSSATIAPAGTVYVRQTSSASGNTRTTATVTAAGATFDWNVTTILGVQPPNLSFTPVANAWISNTGGLPKFYYPDDNQIGNYYYMSTNHSNVTITFTVSANAALANAQLYTMTGLGNPSFANTKTVAPNANVGVRIMSANTPLTTIRATVVGAGYEYYYDVTTLDYCPLGDYPGDSSAFNSYVFEYQSSNPPGPTAIYQGNYLSRNRSDKTVNFSASSNNSTVGVSNSEFGPWTSNVDIVANGILYSTITTAGGFGTFYCVISSNTGYSWLWTVQNNVLFEYSY